MTFDLDIWRDGSSSPDLGHIHRSKVISFESYRTNIQTHTHTQRTDGTTWTTKLVAVVGNNRLKPRLHDTTCCQTGCTTGCTTGCQTVVSCKRGLTVACRTSGPYIVLLITLS